MNPKCCTSACRRLDVGLVLRSPLRSDKVLVWWWLLVVAWVNSGAICCGTIIMCPINVVRDSGIATTATSGLLATGGGEFSEIFAAQQKQQQQQQHPKELRHHRQHQQKHRPQSSDQQHFSEQHLEHQSLQQQHFLDHQPNEQPYDLHLHHLHHQHQHHTQHQQEQQQQQFEQQLFASNTTATASDSLYGWDENYASSSSSHALVSGVGISGWEFAERRYGN